MIITIEVLIILIICLLLLVWFVWYKLSLWLIRKKYKPENNLSRKGGIEKLEEYNGKKNRRRELADRSRETESREPDIVGPPQHAEQGLCKPASSSSTRKNRNSVRGIFKKPRR